MARGAQDWRSIHGSAALRTAPLAAVSCIARAEAIEPGEMRRIPVNGELLGAARARGRVAAIPLDAFDRVGRLLEPEEQGAYFQLLRLSWGEGRNFCRAAQKDLLARLGTSERRLHRILDGLVEKGLVKLLHRDNRGTLYRVFLPGEAAGEPLGDDVMLGRACEVLPPAPIPLRAHSPRVNDLSSLAARLAAARGGAGERALTLGDAAEEIDDLLAEGATPRQIEAAIGALEARARSSSKGSAP